MKKLALILIATCISLASVASQWIDVEEQNIPIESVINYFTRWFDLSEESTFEAFNDHTDEIGMRHISYQQFLSGVKVEHNMVIVHARNGKVISVNADILETAKQPKSVAPKVTKNQARTKVAKPATDGELMVVKCQIYGKETYRLAYKIIDTETQEEIYIDAETGEIVKRLSLIYNADVQGTAQTMYNGVQNLTIYDSESQYILADSKRKIQTFDGQTAQPGYVNYINTHPETSLDESFVNARWQDFMNTCRNFEFSSSNCQATYLKSVTIKSTPNKDWWYNMITDANPDFYVKIVDAKNNVIYESGYYPDQFAPVTFNMNVRLSGNFYIEIYDYDGDYIVNQDDFGGSIRISNTSAGTYTWNTTNSTGEITIKNGTSPEIDAHWGMQKTYDFYKTIFNRNSFDNNGAVIRQYVGVPKSEIFSSYPNNASGWNISKFSPYLTDIMCYGLGDGVNMRPVVALDVMAHEFTHLVTNNNGNGGLEYQAESGALNESFSDIFGFSVENYTSGDTDYLIAEDVMIPYSNMRSMKDPKLSMDGAEGYQSPDTYQGDYWVNTSSPNKDNDNGGVHTNSGVQNKWFYLLSEGGQGVNDNNDYYRVQGITIQKAQKIAYRNLITYLTPQANYMDARNGSLRAAADLYGKDSQEYKSVQNAWYAVGVGEPAEVETASEKFVIVAKRSTGNYFYMTSDLGTAGTKRFQAVDAGTDKLWEVQRTDLDDKFVWEAEMSGSTVKLKNGTQYVDWTSGNSATLSAAGRELSYDLNADFEGKCWFVDNENYTRYLSLNKTVGNDYFAFYKSGQIEDFVLLLYQDRDCTKLPFNESFANNSQGDFTIENVVLPAAASYTWQTTDKYGMKASAYIGKKNYAAESWLISPCIDLGGATKPVLTFEHAHQFASVPANELTLWISENYFEGVPSTATWKQLTIPHYTSNSSWAFESSGNIDLSAYVGKNVSLAWKYTSSASAAATWEVKNVSVTDKISTATREVDSEKIIVFAKNNAIHIFGTSAGEPVEIYNVSGICVYKGVSESVFTQIPAQQGFYIVKVGDSTQKVVVK